ncbi:hypothetical protein [Paenarthrobacter sp. Y-19]|uniref:hypothetical protein n=1 Tax=Paenarthrobacter sp. Y-19 TaxID=3031125 RepID=UPI0023DCCAAD|nr:hypothetical protein [Paenarthrobacter sp. Y-19]
MNGTDPTLSFEIRRNWPVTFRDWDSLKAFLNLVSNFANGSRPHIGDGKTTYASADEFFSRPNPLNTELYVQASAGGKSFSLHLTTQAHYPDHGTQEKSFVTITATELQQAQVNQIWVADLFDEFDRLTKPLTRFQRWRNRPVVTKRTEAEYYADRRAAKVRWQSWALGVVGGFIGAAAAFYSGFKP